MSHARAPRHGKWEGFEALHAALQGLASAKGTSQNRIGAVAKLALQNAKVRPARRVCRQRGVGRGLTDERASVSVCLSVGTRSFTSMWCTTWRCFCGKPSPSTDWQVRHLVSWHGVRPRRRLTSVCLVAMVTRRTLRDRRDRAPGTPAPFAALGAGQSGVMC